MLNCFPIYPWTLITSSKRNNTLCRQAQITNNWFEEHSGITNELYHHCIHPAWNQLNNFEAWLRGLFSIKIPPLQISGALDSVKLNISLKVFKSVESMPIEAVLCNIRQYTSFVVIPLFTLSYAKFQSVYKINNDKWLIWNYQSFILCSSWLLNAYMPNLCTS